IDRQQTIRHYATHSPIDVIPGGVDLDRFSPMPRTQARVALGLRPNQNVVLFVGRIQRLKGLEVLVRAFARLGDLDARLLVVGGQPGTSPESREISRLQPLVTRLGIDERTEFVGAVAHEQLPLSYSAADVAVMPTRH